MQTQGNLCSKDAHSVLVYFQIFIISNTTTTFKKLFDLLTRMKNNNDGKCYGNYSPCVMWLLLVIYFSKGCPLRLSLKWRIAGM